MSNQADALSYYSRGMEAGNTRKEVINTIERMCGVSSGYASTLYNNARKTFNALHRPTAPGSSPTNPTPTIKKPKAKKSSGKTESFTHSNLDGIQSDIDAALAEVAKKYGIQLDTGSIRFSDNQFTTKITAKTGDGSNAARDTWNLYCFRGGLKATDFGKTFTSTSGNEFKIVGWNPKGKKYNVIAERVRDGGSYKFPASQVRTALNK